MNDLFKAGIIDSSKYDQKDYQYKNQNYTFLELEEILRHKWENHKQLAKVKINQLSKLFAEIS